MNKKVLAALGLTSNVSAYTCSWSRVLYKSSNCSIPAGLLSDTRQPATQNATWSTWAGIANNFTVTQANAVNIGECAEIKYSTNAWKDLNVNATILAAATPDP